MMTDPSERSTSPLVVSSLIWSILEEFPFRRRKDTSSPTMAKARTDPGQCIFSLDILDFYILLLNPKKLVRYGYHQRENTGSRLFTEVKPCWTGLISGWVTISIKYPVLYSLGSHAGVVDINHAFHLYYNVVCGSSFSRSQPDFDWLCKIDS